MKEKFLGVDFGDARTGLALSEATGLLAVGAGCIRCGNLRKTAEQVAAFAKEQGRGAIALHGKMIDAPIVNRAKQTIAMAEALGMGRGM